MDDKIKKHISEFRQEYQFSELDEHSIEGDPIEQFSKWFNEAVKADCKEPNAMALGTVSSEGKPSVRIILLKGFNRDGFNFYSNYDSRKGKELKNNPFAALTFYWPELQRQVRIEGFVTKLGSEQSDEYFNSRPKGSQIGSVASPQSQIIKSRKELENKYEELLNFYENKKIERPEHWGGYLLNPENIEFWQGRLNRLHDRILFEFKNKHWQIHRLAP